MTLLSEFGNVHKNCHHLQQRAIPALVGGKAPTRCSEPPCSKPLAGKRPVRTRERSGRGCRRLPVPGEEVVEACHGVAARHALENVFQVGIGLDVVELRGRDERGDDRPTIGAAVRSGEQVVLAPERDRADRSLDRIGVEFDAAVIEEAAEGLSSGERVSGPFGQPAAHRHAARLALEPRPHGIDNPQVSNPISPMSGEKYEAARLCMFIQFQSTPACERTRSTGLFLTAAAVFQSTPACERATLSRNNLSVRTKCFNPRPRVSGRRHSRD